MTMHYPHNVYLMSKYLMTELKSLMPKHKYIPFITLALRRDQTSSDQLQRIRATLSEHFDYDARVTLHSLPYGQSTARVEFASHSDVALSKVFNVLGEWNAI